MFRYFGGNTKSFYYGHICFLALQVVIGVRTVLFQRQPKNDKIIRHFLEPLLLFENRITHNDLQISEESKVKIEDQAKKLFKINQFNLISFSGQWFLSSTVMTLWKFDWQRSPFVTTFSVLHYWFFIFYCFGSHLIGLTYFYIISKVCEAKISYLKEELDSYESYTLYTNVKLLTRHSDVCRSVSMYNKYWKHYISTMIGSFVPLISLVCYMAFISDNPLVLKGLFLLACPAFMILLSFVVLCAAKVSKDLIRTHRQLLVIHNHVLKSKKSQVQWILTKLRRIKRVLIRFELPITIGFSCGDLFYVSYQTYADVSLISHLINTYVN